MRRISLLNFLFVTALLLPGCVGQPASTAKEDSASASIIALPAVMGGANAESADDDAGRVTDAALGTTTPSAAQDELTLPDGDTRRRLAAVLAAQARLAGEEDPSRGLLLAVESLRVFTDVGMDPFPAAEQVVRDLLGEAGRQDLSGQAGSMSTLAFSGDGRWLAAAGEDGLIQVWAMDALDQPAHILAGHEAAITGLAFAPSSETLASVGRDNTVRLWSMDDLASGPTILGSHDDWINALTFSPDGRHLATASDDTTVRVWSLAEPEAGPQILRGHENWVDALVYAPDSATADDALASGGLDGSVRIWTPASQETPRLVLTGDTSWVHALAFSPDGARLASASEDGAIREWALDRPNDEPKVLTQAEGPLSVVKYDSSGRWLAAAGNDPAVHLWDRSTDNYEHTWLAGPDAPITQLQFNGTGDRLAAAGMDAQVYLWAIDFAEAGPVLLAQPGGSVRSLALSPDDRWIATAGGDYVVRLWPMQADWLIERACEVAGRNFTNDEWSLFYPGEPYRLTCADLPPHPSVAEAYVARGITYADRHAMALAQDAFAQAAAVDASLDLAALMAEYGVHEQGAWASVHAIRPNAKFGVDALRPIDVTDGDLSPIVADPNLVANTGAAWVRINFVLGPWGSVSDEALHGGRTWQEAYRQILDGYRRKGIRVYGLISFEALAEDPGDSLRWAPQPDAESTPWIDNYVDTFVSILRLFPDRIDVVEPLNEPDDWHGGYSSWIHPGWLAIIQQRVYERVRQEPDLQYIKIVSSPLQGLYSNSNSAASYLQRFYWAGKARYAWGSEGIPYPFDGVGYHLYILQQYYLEPDQQRQAIRSTYRRYVDQMVGVVRNEEGQDRPLYISEIGWQSQGAAYGVSAEDLQAENLSVALSLIAEDPQVALGIWFAVQDFHLATSVETYGLYRVGDLSVANRKPAYTAYKAIMQGIDTEWR